MKLRWLLILALLVVGCGAPRTDGDLPVRGYIRIGNGVYRFIDDEAGVVCWIFKGSQRAGLSCLPLGHTILGR